MDLNDATAFAFLVWLAYFVLSRKVRDTMMRVLASIVGWAILALPLDQTQWTALAVAQTLVILYDAFSLFETNPTGTRTR